MTRRIHVDSEKCLRKMAQARSVAGTHDELPLGSVLQAARHFVVLPHAFVSTYGHGIKA